MARVMGTAGKIMLWSILLTIVVIFISVTGWGFLDKIFTTEVNVYEALVFIYIIGDIIIFIWG